MRATCRSAVWRERSPTSRRRRPVGQPQARRSCPAARFTITKHRQPGARLFDTPILVPPQAAMAGHRERSSKRPRVIADENGNESIGHQVGQLSATDLRTHRLIERPPTPAVSLTTIKRRLEDGTFRGRLGTVDNRGQRRHRDCGVLRADRFGIGLRNCGATDRRVLADRAPGAPSNADEGVSGTPTPAEFDSRRTRRRRRGWVEPVAASKRRRRSGGRGAFKQCLRDSRHRPDGGAVGRGGRGRAFPH